MGIGGCLSVVLFFLGIRFLVLLLLCLAVRQMCGMGFNVDCPQAVPEAGIKPIWRVYWRDRDSQGQESGPRLWFNNRGQKLYIFVSDFVQTDNLRVNKLLLRLSTPRHIIEVYP